MTAVEFTKEIGNALGQVPDGMLADILDLIKEVQLDKSNPNLTSNLRKILYEDGDLLRNLA